MRSGPSQERIPLSLFSSSSSSSERRELKIYRTIKIRITRKSDSAPPLTWFYGVLFFRLHLPPAVKSILFVCTGNICRSPMAEGIFREMLKGRGDIVVSSAGVGTIHGQPPSLHAVEVLRPLGLDISK